MSTEAQRALVVYYSFTNQTARVAGSIADALTKRGVHVTTAVIGFTDPQYGERFEQLPMHRPIWNITRMLPAQARKKTGEITIPAEARTGDYDLVVVGSPTWWLTTCMPVRSYLQDSAVKVIEGTPFAAFSVSRRYWKGNVGTIKQLGERKGGSWQGETHFLAYGNQVMSMWSWLSFMRHNEPRARSLGVKMPRPNLRDDFNDQAAQFANRLADALSTPELRAR